MNSFRSVVRALRYEIERQETALRNGERIVQETRNWDEARGITYSTRSKEQAHDYRYFPDPDLVPLTLEPAMLERWRADLPELPAAKRERYVRDFGLPAYDAGVLTEERATAEFFESVAKASDNPKQAANWMMGDVRRVLQKHELTLAQAKMRPQQLADLIALVANSTISGKAAKEICEPLVVEGLDPKRVVEQRGLAQTSDASAVAGFVDQALAANPDSVASYKAGKEKAFEFLVGQVMKVSRGKANVEMVRALLKERLG
jgi:aspartyl-tRNA(Asn)/glutamyl-tRNA(Gln) amidotransferase subunit B